MLRILSHIRTAVQIVSVFLLIFFVFPAAAQQPAKVDPQAGAVQERQLLGQSPTIQGRGTIPDVRSYVLEQPEGRVWTGFRRNALPWFGGIFILGALIATAVFYFWRGPVRVTAGMSGIDVVRFSAFERFVHWMTASSFIVLAISGLNITFGRSLLLPLMDPLAFTTMSQWLKYAHNFLSVPFTIGVVLMLAIWTLGNLPNRTDLEWVKRGGGLLGKDNPPAGRFNPGQKLIFWIVVIGGIAAFITGSMLIFPFYYGTTIEDLQTAQRIHGIVAIVFIVAIIGHIYIGTLGMEGAFRAMAQGTVDRNWALEHHILWLQQLDRKQTTRGAGQKSGQQPQLAERSP